MRRRHALSIAIAAVLGALAIAAIPALAGAKDDHGQRGNDAGHRHHHNGDRHRHNIGQITEFDAASGQLTIARFGGGTIAGMVTSETEIRCEGRGDGARVSRDHGGNSGPGSSNSGPGSSNSGSSSGDDHGGRGEEEPGDDHGEGAEPGDDNGGQGEEEPGDDRGEGRNDERTCTTADLTVGAVVHNLDRSFDGGTATFEEVELAPTH